LNYTRLPYQFIDMFPIELYKIPISREVVAIKVKQK